MGRPAKTPATIKRALVTIKGKAREPDLSRLGLPPLRINIIKGLRGHKQVEIEVIELTDGTLNASNVMRDYRLPFLRRTEAMK